MLWYCRFKWHSATTPEQVRQRVVQQHDAGTNQPDKIRGWYNLVGGGAGFLLVETSEPADLNTLWRPYLDLMDVDIHALTELPYEQTIAALREGRQPGQTTMLGDVPMVAATDPETARPRS